MVFGNNILKTYIQTKFILIAKCIVVQQKEHFDGSGFPKRSSRNRIYNASYIVSLVETFDALLSKNGYYGDGIPSKEEVYFILQSEMGNRFHPKITEIFLDDFEYFIQLREKIIRQNKKRSL